MMMINSNTECMFSCRTYPSHYKMFCSSTFIHAQDVVKAKTGKDSITMM